ncbi:hypothetical protein [Pontiella agarivorans]|uniref:ATP-binding protein n=1 Tax=Pontiella agarivorans TaxID=3038953 RepID=A0ABU5MTK8_9BACT|nr:hypothetical protein [Pontiella agarivorans]MDZ8117537.1 hypothetical protein [Pontiella agarivorans]
MRVFDFWRHWNVLENPFSAEEATDDPVFLRLLSEESTHPDFAKIYGTPEHPSSAIVFGEKGSGKTALRLTMEKQYALHNESSDKQRVWVVRYDDQNAALDTFASRYKEENPLRHMRLEDHQDAMLALAVTKLVDTLMGERPELPGFSRMRRRVKRMNRRKRLGLCLLSALYDQPNSLTDQRFERLRKLARIQTMQVAEWVAAGLFALIGALLLLFGDSLEMPRWVSLAVGGIGLVGAALLVLLQGAEFFRTQTLAARLRREIKTVSHTTADLARKLRLIGRTRSAGIALPMPGDHDSRYELNRFLLAILEEFGYSGMVVLVDRVDEPAMINGDAQKMKELVWPMLNNKFLQQQHIGIKLLLPIELRYLVHRESEDFYMKARLDKQCMIDRLAWSGSALYDLANMRLKACCEKGEQSVVLSDFFDDDVVLQDVLDALGQMQQPRDAFKLLYQVVHEHCSYTPNEDPVWKIPRLTLAQVSKNQARRLNDMQRGLQPA